MKQLFLIGLLSLSPLPALAHKVIAGVFPSGEAIEGAFSAVWLFGQKVANAFAPGLVGIILGVFGWQASTGEVVAQSDAALGALRIVMSLLPAGANVLDWGCGPAASSFHLKAAGFNPDPVDASPEMVAIANDRFGLSARVGTFDDPVPEGRYQGVWANFSLLHAPRLVFRYR